MKWRRVVRIFHRDIGYVTAVLTIIFAISGIALNHIENWNPNYVVEKTAIKIEPISDSVFTADAARAHVVAQLNIADSIKSHFRPSPNEIDIFLEGKTISANLSTGIVSIETIEKRVVFKEMNFLHLNTPKKLWKWISDLFAASLIILAITGLFMIKGKNGFKGRGKWLFLFGAFIPILFLFIYY
jgi:hypothetical protein